MGYSVVNFVILGAGAVFCFGCRFKKVQEYLGSRVFWYLLGEFFGRFVGLLLVVDLPI